MKSLRKILAVVLAIIMLSGTLSVTAGAASVSEFSDFPSGTWSEEALTHAVNNGLLQGKGDGAIAHKHYITRAEVATIINRAFGATVKADISKYTDMDPSKWYYAEIQKAVNMQTVNGVSENEINPEGYITRESVFTIIARAMVLSSKDTSSLSRFTDGSKVSSWAIDSVSAMAARGYVNGDEKGNLNPQANITREEFAQVMYNVFKTYLPEGGVLSDAAYGTTVVRGRDVVLKNIKVNGDLVVADGVGTGNITLNNVDVTGRILFRGGEGKVTIDKNSSVGEFVIVHDVNGTVNFNNYKTEAIFKGVVLDTPATFLKPSGGGGGIGGGTQTEEYTITYNGKDYYVDEGDKIGDAEATDGTKLSDALAGYTAPAGYTNDGFKDKATGKKIDLTDYPTDDMEIVPNDIRNEYDVIYNAMGGTINGQPTYTADDVLNVENGYTLDKNIIPERDGYTFAGWYIDTVGQAIVTVVPAGIGDVTVYAKWEENAQLTFRFDSAKSNDTTVAINVEIDKLPYGVDKITSIVLEYEYLKSGTTDTAELTYSSVTATNGTATGNGTEITWTGNVTSGGTLFTIIFTKDKSVGYDVDFKFGDVTIKEDSEEISGYDKVDKTINIGTGKEKYTVTYNGTKYYAYEDEKIGDAEDTNGNKLSDVLANYNAPSGYTNFGFKNKVTGSIVNPNDYISASMEIVPNDILNTYDVIYNAMGGTVNGNATYTASDVISIEGGYTLDTSLTMERAGHRFLGWYMDTATETIITSVPAGTADVTVYAKWEAVYVITYDGTEYYAYDGDKIGDAEDTNGNKLSGVLASYSAPAGYTNYGFKNKVTGSLVDLNADATESIEIVPNDILNTYDVIYNANGGTINGNATYTASDVLTVNTGYTLDTTIIPQRGNYKFLGWYIDSASQAVVTAVPAGTADVTVYAKWEGAYVVKYNGIEYYAYDGDKIGDAEDTNGNKLSGVLASYSAPAGYTNNGFKNKVTGNAVDLDAQIAEDLEIVPNDILNTYDVIYNAMGGTVNGNATYTASDVISIEGGYTLDTSLTMERAGHRFLGWYMDTATETIITSVPAGTADVTVYAKWEAVYVITYDGTEYYAYDGDKIGEAEDTNGNKLSGVLASYSAPAGYTNDGFKNKVTGSLVDLNADATESIEIVPNDILNTYDVIYNANGGTINGNTTYTASDVLTVNAGYTLDTSLVPVRRGYKFEGWYMDTATETIITSVSAGTGDVTVYAKWTAKGTPELGFKYENDTDARKVTLHVTLSDIPYNMDDLAGIMLYYSQAPKALEFESAVPAFAGTFSQNEQHGTISWYNNTDPITPEMLSGNNNVLFTLTFSYDVSTEETVVFSYDETELVSSDLKIAGAGDYTTSSVTININKSVYIVTFGGNTYEVVHGSKLSDNALLKAAMEAAVPALGHELTFKGTYILGGVTKEETVTLDTVPTADMTITAIETPIEYTIKYYSNGVEIFPGEATYTVNDLPYTLPNLSDTAEDKFLGWYDNDAFSGSVITAIASGTTGDLEFFAKWDKALYIVTLFEGTTKNKGSYDIPAGGKITQSQIDAKLGAPDTYTMQQGYVDSDGKTHEIAPELWYKVGSEWEIFEPEKVVINRDIDIHLFTRYAAFYYDTDITVKGIKIPRTELVIAYDSNTDIIKSFLDTLTAMGGVLEGTIDDIETTTGTDLFQAALDKAAKTGLVDTEGNILNPQIPVPLHKLITEDLIMREIDRYIDNNINNEEFIAEILRNDTVVDMLLDDKSIRTKVLSDTEMRNKLLTDAAIKRIISKDEVIDWIITNEDFKKSFIDSDATFDYILGDLKALLDNAEYHDMLIDACVEFVIDVYFEKTVSAPELVDYIDTVLDSQEFIEDIEKKPELRSVFKDEIKGLFKDINKPETSQDTRDEIYAEIRGNATIKNAIIDAIVSDEEIMEIIMKEVRDDLASSTSQYKQEVIDAVRDEFADPLSTLKSQIKTTVKNDIALGAASTLRDAVIGAVTNDFALGAQSSIKGRVTAYIESQITVSGSVLRESILDEAADSTSPIADYVKNYVSGNAAIADQIKVAVKNDSSVKAEAKGWISTNIGTVKGDIETAIKTDRAALTIAIQKSGYEVSESQANTLAQDYISGSLNSLVSNDIDNYISSFFANDTNVLSMVDDNFDVFYEASYDSLFDELYADSAVFETAYASYVSDRTKLADAFDDYITYGTNLSDAIDAFVDDPDNLKDAIETFVDNATDADIQTAIDTYIADDDNLISAINLYIANDDNLETVFGIFSEDDTNFEKAFETYIATDDNLGKAIESFVGNGTLFDTFYETHLGVNAADPDIFNALFESYYHAHVHDVADKAWNNPNLHDLIMQYVHDYTEEMVMDYASGALETKHPDLVDTIDSLMHNEFPDIMREKYYEPGSTIKVTVDHLIEEEGVNLIKKYANDEITDPDTVQFIKDTIDENIGIIVDEYIDGTLDGDIVALVDGEIDSYMNTLIDDYIADRGDARETLGDLIPTYAQDAVDTLKNTDAFKNTISDFVSGNGVRVNEENIMFISILSELMGEYDFDKIMDEFAPEKATKLINKVGHDLAEKYVNALLDTFIGGIKDAESKLQADLDNDIEGTEYKFTTTPRVRVYFMKDFVESAYNKAVPKIEEKLLSKNALAQNPYVKKLLEKNWLTEFLDYDASMDGVQTSGYSIKKGEYNEIDEVYGSPIIRYYNIILENVILVHDAVMWYGTTYEGSLEEKLDAVSELLGTYANKANDVIMHYIQTGELPKGYTPYEIADKILSKVLGVNDKVDDAYGKFEDKYYENEDRILELVAKIKNFYEEKLNRDYTGLIDLAELDVYADGEAYPVYKIMLELYEENDAFSIDTLATAIFDSDNYHGINVIEKGMSKLKSKIDGFKYRPGVYANKMVRDAYKATLDSREIKGKETGSHSFEVQRYLQYIK